MRSLERGSWLVLAQVLFVASFESLQAAEPHSSSSRQMIAEFTAQPSLHEDLGGPSDGGWLEVPPLTERYRHTTIYDPVRHRMIVFGGNDGVRRNDVWVFALGNSTSWTRIAATGAPPSPREQHAAVYDSFRDRLIVFGGDDGTRRNDTWVLSLSGVPAWTQLIAVGTPPSPREEHTAIYDPDGDRIIVFGGNDGARRNDTWALSLSDPPTWTPLAVSGTLPSARYGHTAIYDSNSEQMVIYGGQPTTTANQTWTLSLDQAPTWTQLNPSGSLPEARASHTAVYEPVNQRMIVFGGGFYRSDTWALSLGEAPVWSSVNASGTLPTGRSEHAAIYDPIAGELIVFGGYNNGGGRRVDTWALSLGAMPTWAELSASGTPPERYQHSVIYDPPRDRMIVFGGEFGAGASRNDTWEVSLDGSFTWKRLLTTGPLPSTRFGHSAIYDPEGDRMVVFGGSSGGAETWALSLNGTPAWIQLFPSGQPPAARRYHSAVYDAVDRRMIVFGGLAAAGGSRNDVWALSLAGPPSWSPVSPSGTLPTARYHHSSIVDEVDREMIVFGGSLQDQSDTWALSLSGQMVWTQLNPLGSGPGQREDHTAIADPVRRRMILFAGASSNGYENDIWALSLAGPPSWIELFPTGSLPPVRAAHAATYDHIHDQMVVFGGRETYDVYADGWVLSWDFADLSSCGSASAVVDFVPGPGTEHAAAGEALGSPDGAAVPLGLGGELTLALSKTAVDRPGVDFLIHENGLVDGAIDENFRVEVSLSGSAFVTIGTFSGGTCGVDLAAADVANCAYVRIVDLLPQEPGTESPNIGADIDAIELLNCQDSPSGVPPESFAPSIEPRLSLYPSPARGTVAVMFKLQAVTTTTIDVIDVTGRRVRSLVHGIVSPGHHEVVWDRRDDVGHEVAAGTYFLRLEALERVLVRKVVLIH